MNYEITDKSISTTTRYTVVGDNGIEYYVACTEDDFTDYWSISTDDDEIDPYSDLGSELIRLCMHNESES